MSRRMYNAHLRRTTRPKMVQAMVFNSMAKAARGFAAQAALVGEMMVKMQLATEKMKKGDQGGKEGE